MESFAEYLVGLSIYAVKKTASYFLNEKTKYIELHDKLVGQDQKTEEHFKVLLEADMKVAVNAFERGLKLAAASRSEEGAWKSKFEVALEKAQEGFATVPRPEQKIKCYDIMCICFLALKKDDEACISILHETERILQDGYIKSSLTSLKRAINRSRTLNQNDAEVLEMLFKSVCGAIEVCAKEKNWCSEHRQDFRELFRNNRDIFKATNPSMFKKWEYLQEYKKGSFFNSKIPSGLIGFRNILIDLCQSSSSETYPLGSIKIVLDGSTLTVRNIPLRNKQDFGDLIRYSRDIFRTSSPTMVLLGFILIATLLSLWLLHDTLTSQESDESSSTTIMNYIYAFINLLDVQSVGEHLIQYEKGGIGSLE